MGAQNSSQGGEAPRKMHSIRAPLFIPALGLLFGIVASDQMPHWSPGGRAALVVLSAALAIAALVLTRLSLPRFRVFAVVAIFLAATAIGVWRHQATLVIPDHHIMYAAGTERVLTRVAGTVVSAPAVRSPIRYNPYLPVDPPPRTSFVLNARELRSGDRVIPVTGLVQVRCDNLGEYVKLGNGIVVTGWLYRPTAPRNPEQPDWAALQRRNGIYAAMMCDGPEFVTVESLGSGDWLSWQRRLRAAGRSLLLEPHASLGDDAAASLLEAILLGQRSAVSATMDDAFARTGIVHVLSVSGFHIGVLAGTCWLFARYVLRRGNRVSLITMLGCVMLYALLAEPTAPVLRSMLMTLCVTCALFMRRPAALFNSVCFAAICALLIRPNDAFSAGFQLSFSQVLALIFVVPPLYLRLTGQSSVPTDTAIARDVHTRTALARRLAWRWAVGAAVVAVISWLIAAPLVAYHFQMIAPWAMLQSMFLTPLFTIEIVLGIVTMVLSAVLPMFAPALQSFLHATAGVLLMLVSWMASWPATRISVAPQSPAIVFIAYSLLLVLIGIAQRRPSNSADGHPKKRHWAAFALICVAPLCVAWWDWPRFARTEQTTITIMSVGNGSAALAEFAGGPTAVLDLGASSNMDVGAAALRILKAKGRQRVDAALISHDDLDHFSGIPALLATMSIEKVYFNRQFRAAALQEWPARDLLERLAAHRVPIEEIAAPSSLSLANTTIDVLWPRGDRPVDDFGNDSSLVLMMHVGERRVLFTGDVEREAQAGLLALHDAARIDLHCDVLVAPHHGAIVGHTTELFYRAASPGVVVVSTARDRRALVELVAAQAPRCRVVCTRDVGAVEITINGAGQLSVTTPCAPPGAQVRWDDESSAILSRGIHRD